MRPGSTPSFHWYTTNENISRTQLDKRAYAFNDSVDHPPCNCREYWCYRSLIDWLLHSSQRPYTSHLLRQDLSSQWHSLIADIIPNIGIRLAGLVRLMQQIAKLGGRAPISVEIDLNASIPAQKLIANFDQCFSDYKLHTCRRSWDVWS